jgi:hypothetical protein
MLSNRDARKPAIRILLSVSLLLTLAGVLHGNLIRNGSFEEPFEGTWDTLVSNVSGDWGFARFDTLGQPAPGYAARVTKYMSEYAVLSQTADVPGVNLVLDFDARFQIDTGSSRSWPTAAFVVRYLDTANTELGSTIYYKHDAYNSWYRTDVSHLIDVTADSGWNHYRLNLARELVDSLPGIDPDRVVRVRIELYAYCSGC